MNSLSSAGGLIKRVYVPPTIFGVAAVGNGLVNLAFSLIPLVLIMAFLGEPFHATWWFVPVPLLLLAAFTLGMTLLMSTLAVFFADVVDMFGLIVQSWFFLTPIMYPLNIMPARFQGLMVLNPMYHLVEIFRAPIIEGRLPDLDHLVWAAAWAGGMLLLGWFVITRKAREFAYRI
jgi:ABC-2 type transport system permease protein